MKPLTRRSVMAGSVAAVTALPALTLPVAATEGVDVELWRLWGRYRLALAAMSEARRIYHDARAPYEAEYDQLKVLPENARRFGEIHRMLWEKHGLEPYADAWEGEIDKVQAIVEAIRETKAETVFGVGVKLAVLGGEDVEDIVEAREDALGALGELTGVDLLAATEWSTA